MFLWTTIEQISVFIMRGFLWQCQRTAPVFLFEELYRNCQLFFGEVTVRTHSHCTLFLSAAGSCFLWKSSKNNCMLTSSGSKCRQTKLMSSRGTQETFIPRKTSASVSSANSLEINLRSIEKKSYTALVIMTAVHQEHKSIERVWCCYCIIL